MRSAIALAILTLLAPAALAERFATWPPLDGLDKATRTHVRHLKKSRCLPERDEVTLPAYPGAVVIALDWGRVRPLCAARDGWLDLGAIDLLSKDPPATVSAWYQANLPDFRRYPGLAGDVLINAEIDNFLWDRDYYKYSNVSILPAPAAWQAAGYRSRIELNRPLVTIVSLPAVAPLAGPTAGGP